MQQSTVQQIIPFQDYFLVFDGWKESSRYGFKTLTMKGMSSDQYPNWNIMGQLFAPESSSPLSEKDMGISSDTIDEFKKTRLGDHLLNDTRVVIVNDAGAGEEIFTDIYEPVMPAKNIVYYVCRRNRVISSASTYHKLIVNTPQHITITPIRVIAGTDPLAKICKT